MSRENPENARACPASPIRTRSYQNEMFERSMKGNVIVAMDTGSGKTHIAVLRIMAELERCNPEQFIWFLAPTVSLCTQQHDSIQAQLPSVRTRLLVGSDNVDRWTEQRIWDAALSNVRLIVSTHAILADALSHGFVKITNLALLIFDEAHHCARGHPANRIMRDFYHPTKASDGLMSVPHILGLSASPILRSKISELRTIESNLDSVSITPRLHRQDMFKYVHRPTLHRLEYLPHTEDETIVFSRAICFLLDMYRRTPFGKDLIPIELNPAVDNSHNLKRNDLKDQLIKFYRKATHILKELGTWAADYFVVESIATLRKSADSRHYQFNG